MRRSLPAVAALILAVVLVYARGLPGPFLYDDEATVVGNAAVRDLGLALAAFGQPTAAAGDGRFAGQMFRPLVPLAHALVHAAFGLQPAAFHLLNLLCHVLAAILLWALLDALFGGAWVALPAALWWALHPAHVESVQWISGLDDVLCGVFALAALLAVARGQTALATLAFLVGLLAKETSVVLPLAAFLLVLARTDGPSRWRRAVRDTAPLWLLAAFYLVARAAFLGLSQGRPPWSAGGLITFVAALKAFAIHLRLTFLPVGLRINYLFPTDGRPDAATVVGALALIAALAVIFAAWRRRPLLALGVGLYLAFLLPTSQIFPVNQLVAERFLYLPAVGAAFVFADVLAAVPPIRKNVAVATTVVILLALAAGTIARVGVWLDEETFWRDIIAKEPDILGYRNNLASLYARRGRVDEAETIWVELLRADPRQRAAATNLATLYLSTDRRRQACDLLTALAPLRPGDVEFRSLTDRACAD